MTSKNGQDSASLGNFKKLSVSDKFKTVFGRDLPTDEKEQIDALLRENIANMEITEIP